MLRLARRGRIAIDPSFDQAVVGADQAADGAPSSPIDERLTLDAVRAAPSSFLRQLDGDISAAGGELPADPDRLGSIGATMFDTPGSQDGTVTVLLPYSSMRLAPSQALVRIKSKDGRRYLGMVTAGPFAEPDSLKGDSQLLVTVAVQSGVYLPPYHGRVGVTLLGEEHADGTLGPPRLRPLPNSAVFALDDAEAARVLHAEGSLRLGLVVGHEQLVVGVPSDLKSVLPRHTAVLGTTGSGKSTTIARLIQQAQAAEMAVILLDVEGEYTYLHEQTTDPRMLAGLRERGLRPEAVPVEAMTLYHLVGRDTTNPEHPRLRPFALQFGRLSPYAVIELLEFSDAQTERFLKAYDITKDLLRDLGIFPERGNSEHERIVMDLDEQERGYPRLTLPLLLDVVGACLAHTEKQDLAPRQPQLQSEEAKAALHKRIRGHNPPGNVSSWRALLGMLGRLNRLRVFDRPDARALQYKSLLQPGHVSVVDLSDTGMSALGNLVIADLLHGVQEAQDTAYQHYERDAVPQPARVLLIIEEAHEFLSEERIAQMPVLFQQVARIAKRGRKRWLGLVFVTQLPQHLPRQVFGLVNSYIVHKVTDPHVVRDLQRTVSGIDESLWRHLPGLAPGQAIVSFPHMARPLLVAIDPAPTRLRLVD